jgi:hypothetical protein
MAVCSAVLMVGLMADMRDDPWVASTVAQTVGLWAANLVLRRVARMAELKAGLMVVPKAQPWGVLLADWMVVQTAAEMVVQKADKTAAHSADRSVDLTVEPMARSKAGQKVATWAS